MLTITNEQVAGFDSAVAAQFRAEMVAHSWAYSPDLCRTLGQRRVERFVDHTLVRAGQHGLTKRGPIRTYIELCLLHGSFFDSDPQYVEIGLALRSGGKEMDRADAMGEAAGVYLETVAGSGGENVVKALEKLADFRAPPSPRPDQSEFAVRLEVLGAIFPEKVAYMGRRNFGRLDMRARGVTMQLGGTTRRSEWSILALMLAFGHGCTADPLYPWIYKTLHARSAPGTGDARIAQVERKARIWLDAVLGRQADGTPA